MTAVQDSMLEGATLRQGEMEGTVRSGGNGRGKWCWSRTVVYLAIALTGSLMLPGCKSYWVNASIQNLSGQPVQELEVDYPTASFGTNSLGAGATMQYRLKIRGSGPVKVVYTTLHGGVVQAQGLDIFERQSGQLTIVLLPGGKVNFLDQLQPGS